MNSLGQKLANKQRQGAESLPGCHLRSQLAQEKPARLHQEQEPASLGLKARGLFKTTSFSAEVRQLHSHSPPQAVNEQTNFPRNHGYHHRFSYFREAATRTK